MGVNGARFRHLRDFRGDLFYWTCRLFLLAWLIIVALPVIYVVGVSLSPDLGNNVAYILPTKPTLANYVGVSTFFDSSVGVSLGRILINNSIYTVLSVIGGLIVASTASFAFATMTFKGRRLLLALLLMPLITPIATLLIPEFVNLKYLNLLGGYQSLILPEIAFNTALPTLILTTFFRGLPKEVLDRARLDGCGNFQLFRYIVMPMSTPAVATCIILLFLTVWNEFPLAVITLQAPDLWNIPVALSTVQGGRAEQVPWQLIAAAIVIGSIPITAVFLLFQRRLVAGLTEGAVKG
jgi:ABC-type glycerol-3-phosphate transport system permease component